MDRRKFIKVSSSVAGTIALSHVGGSFLAHAEAATKKAALGPSGSGQVPDFAGDMLTSDMLGLGSDGKPTGQKATFTGASMANATAEEAAKHQMKLTAEEQAMLDGEKGEEVAKLMKILVLFGNTFGAEKLVDLGGAPHSNLYPGAPYLNSMIKMLDECAEAGLKPYAPYTVNPRPYDVYNVQNNTKEMEKLHVQFERRTEASL